MTTPAGWYPDPNGEGQRYWDGQQWTEHRAPAAAAQAETVGFAAPAATSVPAPQGARSGTPKILGGIAAVVLVIAAGFFAFKQMASADGGAGSPEEAVEQLMEALDNEDLAGMAEVLLPGERRTFVDPLFEGFDHLQRWGVLDDTFDTENVEGMDITVDGLELRTESVADDIVNVYASGSIVGSIRGEDLPIGDLIREYASDLDLAELDSDGTPDSFQDARITTVEENGRWYVSMMYSLAEAARLEAGAPPVSANAAIQPVGSASPGEAVESMMDALVALDLEGIIAHLNPDEAEALHRYASLFLPDAEAALNSALAEVSYRVQVDRLDYDITERDDIAVVTFTAVTISGEIEGEAFGLEWEGNCVRATFGTEVVEECADQAATPPPGVGLSQFTEQLDELGLVVAQVDGKWYVSPIQSTTEVLLAVMRAIDRSDIETFIDQVENGTFAQSIDDQFGQMFGLGV